MTRFIYLLFNLTCFFYPAETGGEVPGEPQGADSVRVSCPGGARVQPSPAGARDHAALQTPPADFLALVTHQEAERRAPLLITWFPRYPSSHVSPHPRPRATASRYRWLSHGCTSSPRDTLPPLRDLTSANGTHFLKRSSIV